MRGFHPKIEVEYGDIITVVRQTEKFDPVKAVEFCDAVISSLIEERKRIIASDIRFAQTCEIPEWQKKST